MSDTGQLIGWLRAATPDRVLAEAARLLVDSTPEDELWAAGALTAARYLNNQARNLLGFVTHAMIGIEDARHLARSQPTPVRHLLLLQSLHQVVCDLHDPCFAPYELLRFWPLREGTTADNIAALRADIRFGEYMRCDHRFVALEQDLSRAEFVDLLLDIGLEGMITDDHTLITPVLCLGLTDLVGWERGFDMLRGALRYSASFPRDFGPYDRAVALLNEHGLQRGAPTTGLQPERVEALRQAFHAAAPADRPAVAARAMAHDGYSPETVLATITLAGCDMYLMVDPVPHEDYDAISREVAPIHIGTSSHALRRALPWMSPRTAALAAIQGGSLLERGPSVLDATFAFTPFEASRPYPYAEDIAALRDANPDDLLHMLERAVFDHDHRTAVAAVHVYGTRGENADVLIAKLVALAATDNGTLLHNFKHLNAMVEEFCTSVHPDRWNYLVAATRFMAWYGGTTTQVHTAACDALGISTREQERPPLIAI
jgi:hypothetical protein